MHSSPLVFSNRNRCRRGLPRFLLLPLALIALTALPPLAIGQSTGGRVLGRVLDPSGAVVPDVSLILTNDDSGKALAVQSSKIGDYIFPSVQVGTYHLEAQVPGFQNF